MSSIVASQSVLFNMLQPFFRIHEEWLQVYIVKKTKLNFLYSIDLLLLVNCSIWTPLTKGNIDSTLTPNKLLQAQRRIIQMTAKLSVFSGGDSHRTLSLLVSCDNSKWFNEYPHLAAVRASVYEMRFKKLSMTTYMSRLSY